MSQSFYKRLALSMIIALISAYFCTVNAVADLDNPRDVLSSQSMNALASHSVRFVLPVSSQPILETDYIIINLPGFSGVTAPFNLTGSYSGTPVFSSIATSAKVTGIRVEPGSYVSIGGITAYNPPSPDLFDVFINVSIDPDGLTLKNSAHVMATLTDGSVLVNATMDSDVATLRIQGFAPPGMFLTFSEGSTVVGTTVSSELGVFMQLFPGIAATQHNILIYGSDLDDRTTPPTYVEVYTRAREVTTVSGIIIPPTISLDKEAIAQGEAITVSGSAVPGYTVKIFSEAPLNSYEVIADADGRYSYTISDTADLDFGDHKVYAMVQDSLGSQSLFSLTLFFRVTDGDPPPIENPDCSIFRGDLNCDGTVDLIDFSILLYYWSSSSAKADINNDGSVDLIDFSIMMFYWQG